MSEKKPFDMKNIENIENIENTANEEGSAEGGENSNAAEAINANENAPRTRAEKPKAKKRKGGKISVRLTAALLVIAVLFGVALGFALERGNSRNKLNEAQITIDALTARIAESEGFRNDTDGLTDENIDALNQLAGDGADVGAERFSGDDEAFIDNADGAAESVTVAEFNGGTLMSDEVVGAYNDRVAGYIFSGYSQEDIPDDLLEELLAEKAEEKILKLKAQEMGVYELTDADKAEIAAEAESAYAELLALYRGDVAAEGKDEAAVIEETKAYLAQNEGISYDSVYAMLSESRWMQKLYDAITEDVRIESTDIIQLYNEKLESQKAAFNAYSDDYEATQMNGETIVYNLEGYRAVRLLSIAPDGSETASLIEEELTLLDAQSDAERIAQYQAELDDIYAPAEASMQTVLQQLADGASFDDMLAQFGEDVGMQTPELQKTGYYISEASLMWPQQMIESAMALQNAGDISEPFRMNGSVCILEYVGDVTPGVVSIDALYDVISEEALEQARAEAYENTITHWISEADVRYYPERMR